MCLCSSTVERGVLNNDPYGPELYFVAVASRSDGDESFITRFMGISLLIAYIYCPPNVFEGGSALAFLSFCASNHFLLHFLTFLL